MKLVLCVATLAAIAVLPGCGGSPGVDDVPSVTEQMVAVMKTIKDADGAKAAAPKLEALADKIHAYQEQVKTGKNTPPADPAKFADRQAAALTAYGDELQRISSIPDAAVHLQGMIKKMTPDRELAAAVGSQLDAARRDLPPDSKRSPPEGKLSPPDGGPTAKNAGGPKAPDGASATSDPVPGKASNAAAPAKRPELRPDPNYKDNVSDVGVTNDWREWFPSAKKGDFVEVDTGLLVRRHEVIEVAGDSVVISTINQAGGSGLEVRVRMKPGPEPDNPPGLPPLPVENLGSETIVVAGQPLNCEFRKQGKFTTWYCTEVPFDGIVKEESSGYRTTLVSFGRGTGPSPDMSAAPPRRAATPLTEPTPPVGLSPPLATKPAGAKPLATGGAGNQQALDQRIAEYQATMDKCQEEIDRLNEELKEQQKTADELDKKLKRLAMASNKSKRSKDTKSEFQRDLSKARSEISRIEREIKKNENLRDRSEKLMKPLQAQSTGNP